MYGLTNHVNKHHIQTDSKLSKNIKSGPCDQRIKTGEMYNPSTLTAKTESGILSSMLVIIDMIVIRGQGQRLDNESAHLETCTAQRRHCQARRYVTAPTPPWPTSHSCQAQQTMAGLVLFTHKHTTSVTTTKKSSL